MCLQHMNDDKDDTATVTVSNKPARAAVLRRCLAVVLLICLI